MEWWVSDRILVPPACDLLQEVWLLQGCVWCFVPDGFEPYEAVAVGAGGLALLSLCVANSLLSVQCKRCFLALVKPRRYQWMQLNIVKKASIFTMLFSLIFFNPGLMELVILTKMHSIMLLKTVFWSAWKKTCKENGTEGKQDLPVSSWENGLLDGLKTWWTTRPTGF